MMKWTKSISEASFPHFFSSIVEGNEPVSISVFLFFLWSLFLLTEYSDSQSGDSDQLISITCELVQNAKFQAPPQAD